MDGVTGGAQVGDDLATSIPGVFACGNVLHVHDLVDFVSQEASLAGRSAAEYLRNGAPEGRVIPIVGKNGVRYTVPQFLHADSMNEPVTVRFRVAQPLQHAAVCVYADSRLIRRIPKRVLAPGEMESVTLRPEDVESYTGEITFCIEEEKAQ